MKLLLTSNGITNSDLEKNFLELVGNKSNLKIAFIPTAGDPIKWEPKEGDGDEYIPTLLGENKYKTLSDFIWYTKRGYEVMIVDLKYSPDKVKKKLQKEIDVVHISGGDVNYLLDWAKKSKVEIPLKKLLGEDVVYVGVSAGSNLLSPDIGLTWWEPDMNADHVGLAVVDFITAVHQNEEDELKNVEMLRKRKKYLQKIINFPWKVFLVKDGQAIKVTGDKVEHVGPGIKKFI